MDRNLRLALFAATRDDYEDLLDESLPETLAREPLGDAFVDPSYPALVWTQGHTGRVYDLLASPDDPEGSLVRDLAGLPSFAASLRVLDLGGSRVTDLAPLRTLSQLALVRLGVTAGADLAPLLDLPALERVAVTGPLEAPARRVLDELSSRGVLVDDPAPDWAALSAPFVDRNLKLALVNELRGDDLPESWPTFDEYALDEGHLARVLAMPLGADEIEAVEELTWDEGGLPLHHLVYPQWGGEDDTFALTSLAGIEALASLCQLACYARALPEAELDALVARSVVVYEAPFPPALAEAPSALPLPNLAALQLATQPRERFPRGFSSWPLAEREAFLRSIELGRYVLRQYGPEAHHTVTWSERPRDPGPADPPFALLPALVSDVSAPLRSVALRSFAGFDPYAPAIAALDVPLSELDSLAELAAFTSLRALHVTVTPRADLAPLLALPKLTHLTLRVLDDAPTEAQRDVLRTLDRRGVVAKAR